MMRNIVLGILFSVVIGVCPDTVMACHHSIKSVTLDPITACPGDSVSVAVQVELSGTWYDVKRWGSTSIDGVCFEHSNYQSDNGTKTFTEAFTITAPSVPGVESVDVKTFRSDNCSNQEASKSVSLSVIYCCPTCEDGDDCTIEQGDGFVTITCGNTVAYLYDGEDGEDGEPGAQGIPGTSCTVSQDGPCAYISCEDGTSATVCNGEDGEDGEPGDDGESCYVTQEGDCAVIYCGSETTATICDGVDGADGVDGTSCWVEDFPRKAVIHCGLSTAVVWNGLNCWDLNENHRKDFCSPCLRDMFDGGCPTEFIYTYQCDIPEGTLTKARRFAKDFGDTTCEVEVDCVEYVQTHMDVSETIASQICSFTEDINGDGNIDILDCRGSDGQDGADGSQGLPGNNGQNGATGPQGPQGPQGEDGEDGVNGVDGVDGEDGLPGPQGPPGHDGVDGVDGLDGDGCEVYDNGDTTCTIECGDSSVVVYNCSDPNRTSSVEQPETHRGPCGSFDGLTIVGMLLPLGLLRFRSGQYYS